MEKSDIEVLDNLLPSVKDRTITTKDKEIYANILKLEWERIRIEKESLMKYYPFVTFGV